MTFLLTEKEFSVARQAVREGQFTDELYRFLGRLIAAAERSRSLAPAPVASGKWDEEALDETLQAWLTESLLSGGLLRAFDRCQSPRALARYLERSFRNWLIDRARAASGPRLLMRAHRLLASEPGHFVLVHDAQSPMDRWWGRANWEDPSVFGGDPRGLVAAAFGLGDLAIMRFPGSERTDPILSTDDLRRLLISVLDAASSAVNLRLFDEILRERFSFAYAQGEVDLEQAEEIASFDPTMCDSDIHEAALGALGRLSMRQIEVLRRRRDTETLETIGSALGCSRGTVDNEQRRALMIVRECAPTDDDVAAILETVLEMASEEV